MKKDDYLRDSLLSLGRLSIDTWEALAPVAKSADVGVVDLLLLRGTINQIDIVHARANHFGFQMADLREVEYAPELVATIPAQLAWCYQAVPVQKNGDLVVVALADPADLNAIDNLNRLLNVGIEVFVADPDEILRILYLHYAAGEADGARMLAESAALAKE
ncbi:MAG: hypothetical protein AAB381_03575 [Patescibacteria group bacterium]